jgi:hypothetical protein
VLPHLGGEEGEDGGQVGHQAYQPQAAEHHTCAHTYVRPLAVF